MYHVSLNVNGSRMRTMNLSANSGQTMRMLATAVALGEDNMSTKAPQLVRVCDTSVSTLTGVSVGGLELVVVPSAQGPRVFEGRCPHQGTLLSEGSHDGKTLTCRSHGWSFDCSTGKRCDADGPSLTAIPAVQKADGLYIDLGVQQAAQKQATRTVADLPGPRGWPVLGNALQFEVSRFHQDLEAWADQYGSMYAFALGPERGIVISDADLLEEILRARPNLFRRTRQFEPMAKEIGAYGVFAAEGDAWRQQRKLASEALSHRHFDKFFPTLRTAAKRLRTRWTKAGGASVDVLADLMRFTVDVTTGLGFGVEMNTLEKDDEVIQRHLEHVFPALGRRISAPFPYWRYVKLPADRRLDQALVAIHELLNGLMRTAREKLAQLPEAQRQPANFLEAMLLARDDAGNAFSDDTIIGNVMTMLLAGEDTTASSAAWALHELCERPELLERARVEAKGLVDGEGLLPTLPGAAAMPVIDAISYETLRLRAVAPFAIYEPNEDTVIADVAVKKGTPIYTLMRKPGLKSAQFPDGEVFRAERWLEKKLPHTGGGYMPFGAGPRLCPGRSLALLEMRVILSTVIHSFDLGRDGKKEDVVEHWQFTMLPKNLKLQFSPRAQRS